MITLATLPQATAQEVFEQCANHLLTQNQQASSDKQCLYRTQEGLKCAAGCFISDEEYDPKFETGNSWTSLADEGRVPREHKNLIQDLQHIHDEIPIDTWKVALKNLANKWNLNFSFLC